MVVVRRKMLLFKQIYVWLTKYPFIVFESLHGYGVYTARAIQLAKMVIKIKYSNGLSAFVKEYKKQETYIM